MTMLHFRAVDPCDLQCACMYMYAYAQCRMQGLGSGITVLVCWACDLQRIHNHWMIDVEML